MNNILACLKARVAWYEKAMKMSSGEIKWENGFDWPPTYRKYHPQDSLNIPYWAGSKKELENTIAMLEHEMKAREEHETN